MSVEVEATDMLVDSGERTESLKSSLGLLQHFALQALRPAWNVSNAGCLQQWWDLQEKHIEKPG